MEGGGAEGWRWLPGGQGVPGGLGRAPLPAPRRASPAGAAQLRGCCGLPADWVGSGCVAFFFFPVTLMDEMMSRDTWGKRRRREHLRSGQESR